MKAKVMKSIFGSKVFKPVYDEAADAAAKAAADAAAKGSKTFTQDEVNSIVAKEREADKKRNQQLVQQLETLQSSAQMTTDEKQALQTRIEELQTQFMTKEELAAREKKKIEADLSSARDSAINEAKAWRSRYEGSLVQRSILDEAVSNDAFAPSQIVELLSSRSKVAEVMGDDNKPTGKFEVRIAFEDIDKDGKPVTLDLVPNQAVKRMKELPERFGNLFKANVKQGLGSGNQQGADGNLSISAVTKDAGTYRANRAKLKEQGVI